MTYGMRRVRPKNLKRNSKVRIYLVVIGVTVFMLFYLSAHVFILSLREKVIEYQNSYTIVVNEIERLEGEIAGLRKGSRIIPIAQNQLGMEFPDGAPERLF